MWGGALLSHFPTILSRRGHRRHFHVIFCRANFAQATGLSLIHVRLGSATAGYLIRIAPRSVDNSDGTTIGRFLARAILYGTPRPDTDAFGS
jgi:hypothetical protein